MGQCLKNASQKPAGECPLFPGGVGRLAHVGAARPAQPGPALNRAPCSYPGTGEPLLGYNGGGSPRQAGSGKQPQGAVGALLGGPYWRGHHALQGAARAEHRGSESGSPALFLHPRGRPSREAAGKEAARQGAEPLLHPKPQPRSCRAGRKRFDPGELRWRVRMHPLRTHFLILGKSLICPGCRGVDMWTRELCPSLCPPAAGERRFPVGSAPPSAPSL